MTSNRSSFLLRTAAVMASVCAVTALRAQTAPQPSASVAANQPSASTAVTTTPAENPPPPSETIKLTPFEVDATKDKGYFSPTTLAGTRLNSNIADLPSSITVITKQQLSDTGATNINDVFMYEANVEGSRSYTVADVNRNGVHDDLAGYDNSQSAGNSVTTGANVNSTRVRGLGTPDIEVNNFYSANRAPYDSYNINSIEIERGPNSIIFGSGSPAGITNASWTQATIDKFNGDFSVQNSSWNGWRQTADINIPLWKGKAAIYLAQAYTSVGFQRQPASDYTRRQYATITIDPFNSHKTHFYASAEYYNNSANDENTLTPTDFITPWIQAGKPVYNALTETVTYLEYRQDSWTLLSFEHGSELRRRRSSPVSIDQFGLAIFRSVSCVPQPTPDLLLQRQSVSIWLSATAEWSRRFDGLGVLRSRLADGRHRRLLSRPGTRPCRAYDEFDEFADPGQHRECQLELSWNHE